MESKNRSKKCIHEICSVQFTYDQFIEPLCKELKNSKYKVFASYNKSDMNLSKNISSEYIEMVSYRSANPFKLAKSFISIYKCINRVNADIVHLHTPLLAYLARFAIIISKKQKTSKIIYTVHGFMFHSGGSRLSNLIHFCLEWLLSPVCNKMLFVSSFDYALARRIFPVRTENLYVIGNGVDVDLFKFENNREKINLLRLQKNFDKNDFIIGFVGRYVKEKGILELVDAAIELKRNYIPNLKIMLIGGLLNSDYDRTAIKKIKEIENNYSDLIVNIGFIDCKSELANYYKIMDLFCLPSYREGMPTSLIEAMSCGIASIATNIRGCNELIEEGQNGLLVRPKSATDLAEAILRLYESPKTRNKYGTLSRKKIINNHDQRIILNNTLDIIKSL